eukprot:1809087-Pleurochrysis_carterae.AAC.6
MSKLSQAKKGRKLRSIRCWLSALTSRKWMTSLSSCEYSLWPRTQERKKGRGYREFNVSARNDDCYGGLTPPQ